MAEKIKITRLSPAELKNTLQDLQAELRNLRFNKVIGQAANTSRIRVVRRSIAAAQTVLREYELGVRKPREAKDK